MKTAVIYARYSCESQTEQSIEGQLRVCKEFALKNDYLIVDKYIDRAMTGTNDNRNDFQKMLKDSTKKHWQAVIVYKLDRFARNQFESVINRKKLADNGVGLISAMENIPDSPEGKLFMSIIEGYNEYFSEDLRQKVKRGMRETRRKGLYQGGAVLYGYKVSSRKLVIDEPCAKVVNFIYEQYALDLSVSEIIKLLTQKGILYKGKPWVKNTIYGILSNEKYSGKYYHEDELVDNMYPQLIPNDLYSIVREKVEKNRFGKRSSSTVYLLKHKVTCGYCGKSISSETGTAKNKSIKHYYKCIGRKKYQNGCIGKPLQKEALEDLIVQNTITQLNKPEVMNNIIKGLLKQQDIMTESNQTLELLLAEKVGAERALENVMQAIEKGVVSKTTSKRLSELEIQLENIEKQILIERAKTIKTISRDEIRTYYNKALTLCPSLLINVLIKEIIIYNDKIEIYYNSPIKTSPDKNQGLLFLSKYTNIRFYTHNKTQFTENEILLKMFIK